MYGSARPLRHSHSIQESLRALLITNESVEGTEYGFRSTLDDLLAEGALGDFRALAPKPLVAKLGADAAHRQLVAVIRTMQPNLVIVMSPSSSPYRGEAADIIRNELPGAAVLYWEGDPWGHGKPPTDAMRVWAASADVVFSVAMGAQAQLLHGLGARDVQHTLHTYCHIQFGDHEGGLDPQEPMDDCVIIGSRLARWGLVSRIPGAAGRARLVRMMQRHIAKPAIYGPGFHGRGSRGTLRFDRQVAAIRQARVSVNWDHYPGHSGYSSNRLPISMLAGRPHVTTRHPDSSWMPGEELGVFQANSPREVLTIASHLLSQPQEQLDQLGNESHNWVTGRLSKRQALLFMLGRVDPFFATTLPTPWDVLTRSVKGARATATS